MPSDALVPEHPFTLWMNALPTSSLLVPDDIVMATPRRFMLYFAGPYGMKRAKELQSQLDTKALRIHIIDMAPIRTVEAFSMIVYLEEMGHRPTLQLLPPPEEYPETPGSEDNLNEDEMREIQVQVSRFDESAEERICRVHRDVIEEKIPGVRQCVSY